MRTTTAVVVAALSLSLAACSSSEPEETLEEELADLDEQTEDPLAGEEVEPTYLDLDLEENTVEFDNGLAYTFSDFSRGVSTWGDEETPYVGFDVTIDNQTGDRVEAGSGVNTWYTYGDTGTESDPVVDAENDIGTEEEYTAEYPEFAGTIDDGDDITLRFGQELPEDETKFEIRLQPWDIDGAGDVYLTGDVPQD